MALPSSIIPVLSGVAKKSDWFTGQRQAPSAREVETTRRVVSTKRMTLTLKGFVLSRT